MDKPLVAIFSDFNFFSLYLVEILLSKSCNVTVFTADEKLWKFKTNHIADKTHLQISNEKNFTFAPPPTYAVFCCGFTKQKLAFDEFKKLYTPQRFKNTKSIAAFPLEVFDEIKNNAIPVNNSLAIVYLGDLLGPRIDLRNDLFINKLIEEIVQSRSATFPIDKIFYPIFAPFAAKQIAKWIFSFGPYGKEVFLLGPEVSTADFYQQIKVIVPEVKLYYNQKLKVMALPRGYPRVTLATNLSFSLKETFQGIARDVANKSYVNKIPKKVIVWTSSFLGILLFPFVSLLVGGILLFFSTRSFLGGKVDMAQNLSFFARAPIVLGRVESKALSHVPVLGFLYKEADYSLFLMEKSLELGESLMPAIESTKELLGKVLGDEVYDPEILASGLKINLLHVYQTLSLIEIQTKFDAGRGVLTAKKVLKNTEFEKLKNLAISGQEIGKELVQILGKEERQAYLVLFQNNMEIRPTGGFIGSFALLTFEGGRMTDFSVSDVYSADGQLKGHIDPPEAIRKHLGEANWWLRDSNWDPDFPISARRAEWFLDKEIDREVDGVIGIDLHPVRDLLALTGPVYLPDYDMNITSTNLYEKTQEEVQENFFPGTHKKASFLTALSRNLVSQMGELTSQQKIGFLKIFFDNLEERHIQIYLHNEMVQNRLSTLGWSGELLRKECGEGCYNDFVGLVEANVGVNKANYFVNREQDLKVETQGDKIQRHLTITFKNSANPGLGLPAKYKSYIRVLVPEDADVSSQYEISQARGLKEIGFLIEVLAGQTKAVDIFWSSEQQGLQDYGLYVRKQAGLDEGNNLSVAIDGSLLYNSNLVKDTWIQKP